MADYGKLHRINFRVNGGDGGAPGPTGPVGTCQSNGGGGGSGGAGGGMAYIHYNGDPNGTMIDGHTVTTSASALTFVEPTEALKEQIAELEKAREADKERIETLEASLKDREDLEYFQARLYTSLIKNERLRDVVVGPNDILVVHVKTTDVPASHVERFLTRCKKDLQTFWDKLGYKNRVLYVTGEHAGFSAIRRPEKKNSPVIM